MYREKILILTLAALSGCSLTPEYQRPAAPVEATFLPSGSGRSDTSAADIEWRDFFGDPRLRRLIETSLENNRDLRVAALRVERARSLNNIQRAALVPSIDASGNALRQRIPGDLNTSGLPITSDSFQVGLEMPSYELDFFGRIRSLRDQVLEQYLATEQAQRSAQISLTAAVAQQYLTLVGLEEQLELARRTLKAAQRSYELNRQTFEAGVSSELDLSTSEAQREAVRASVAAIEQQRALAESALVLLVGSPLPEDLPPAGSLATQGLMADLPVGLPSELLTRRPDIIEAEHLLKAANANIGVARAAFFPSLKLTGFGGTASADLSGLFESGSGTWNFSPSVSVPLFAAGRNKSTLEVAEVDRRIEVANYEKAIQVAFREVSDALVAQEFINTQIDAQKLRVAASQRRYDLSHQRFEAGTDSFIAVLLAQQELFSAEQSQVQARLARLVNLTNLYAALGGGWSPSASIDN